MYNKDVKILAIVLVLIAIGYIIYRKMKNIQDNKICDFLSYSEFDTGATPEEIRNPNIETYYSKERKRYNVAGTGKANMQKHFLEMLCEARKIADVSFVIVSGYRSVEHNRDEGGVENSAHTKGLACDISTPKGKNQEIIVKALREVGFVRFGIYKNFIHVDCDTAKPQYVYWGTAKHRMNPFKLVA